MLFVQLNFDLEKLIGWQGGTFVWSFADNAGSNLSQHVGNNFQISTDYGPNTFMFNELYVQQSLLKDKLTLKVGYMSLLNDFLSSPLYDVYSNLAFCGNPIAMALNTPATAMPQSSWGAFVKYEQPDWYTQAGIYQVTSRLGQIPYHGADYSIRPGDGTMMLVEGGWTPTLFKQKPAADEAIRDGKTALSSKAAKDFKKGEDVTEVGYPGHYKLGGFLSNWMYAKFSNGQNEPNIYGLYVLADQMVYRERGSATQGLYVWSAFVLTPQEDIANVPYYASGGIQYLGLIPARDNDRSIFGAGYGSYSNKLAASQRSSGQPGEDYEMVFEWAYQIQINPWLTIQPDLQYIVNPGATHTLDNAWVLGALVSVSF